MRRRTRKNGLGMITDGPREMVGGRYVVVKFKGCSMRNKASFAVRLLMSSIISSDVADWKCGVLENILFGFFYSSEIYLVYYFIR